MRVGEGCLILTTFAVFHSVHVFESVLGVLILLNGHLYPKNYFTIH